MTTFTADTTIRNPLDDALVARLLSRVTVADRSNTATITCPFDGQSLAEIPVGTEADVDDAFTKARAAQRNWARTPASARRDVLHHFHDLLFTHQDLMLDVIQAETGKNRASAHEELIHTAITARYYGNKGEAFLAPKRAHGALPVLSPTTVYHHPKGVVGVISPWNYPLTLSISDALAALMAGNAIVLKPDSGTPFTALLAVDFLYRAGLPRDVIQVVPGPGRVVGQAIVNQCDYLMFTGSTATGKALAQKCGERLIGFSAELGGKNPLIVAEDANINRAVEGARIGAFTNSGHLCVSIERVYVADAVWDKFVPAFADRIKAMSLGPGYEWETEMGSLQSQQQFDTVKSMIDEAIAAGATVLAGGRPRPDLGPLFYEPTVLTDVPEGVSLVREEVFGPVVVVERVANAEEGIEKANDSDYGLNASLWTTPRRAKTLAPKIQAGSINVNDGFAASFASVDAPMGGFKESGVGRRQGIEGILKYTDAQTVTTQLITPISMPHMSRKRYATVFNTALKLGKKFKVLP